MPAAISLAPHLFVALAADRHRDELAHGQRHSSSGPGGLQVVVWWVET